MGHKIRLKRCSISLMAVAVSLGSCVTGGVENSTLENRFFDEDESLRRSLEAHFGREEMISECMSREGFEYVEREPPVQGVILNESAIALDDAVLKGYGLGEDFLWSVGLGDNPNEDEQIIESDSRLDELSPEEKYEFDRTLYGEGGCEYRAMERFPDTDQFTELEEDLVADAMNRAKSTSDYLDALDAWKECMAGEGFPGVEPLQLFLEIRAEFDELAESASGWGETAEFDEDRFGWLLQREVAAATADATCSADLIEERERLFKIELLQNSGFN